MLEWIKENLYMLCTLLTAIGVPTVIELSPIKIDPWSKLFGWIGNAMTAAVREELADMRKDQTKLDEKVENLTQKLESFKQDDKQDKADQARGRILRFSDECRRGELHSKEHWDRHMEDIDKYETYCDTHPGYKNSKAVAAISLSKKQYEARLEKNDFLV